MIVPIAIGAVLLVALVYISVSRLWQSDPEKLGDPLASRQSFEGEPWWERQIVSRRMSIDAGLCRVCSKPTTTRCSKCRSVKYCSRACQNKDWLSGHKHECPNLKHLAEAASSGTAAAPTKPPPPDPNEEAPVPRQVLFPYQHYLQLCHNRTSCRRPPVGLTNLGNNCYANAALQCLLANRPLRAYLDQGLHSSSCNKPNRHEWCLLCELQALCKRMADAAPGDEVTVRPLLRHLRRFAKTLSYGRQEDAHEFFYSLLNTMEAIQLTNYGGKERFDMRSQETTLVHHVFGGYLRSQVICCGCGQASRRYEAALDLQLEVPPGVDRLEDALARHTADEVLDGDNRYACDGCKQRCRATRSTCFEVAPNSLVLCLKRFGTGRFGKINKMLAYGEHLDLKPYMAQQAMDDGQVTYTLSGVIVHLDQMNSTSFGHYICFVRTADNRWYSCDDSRIGATSPSRVLSQNAYMLFYQRDTPKPEPQPGYKRPKPLTPAAIVPAAVVKQQQEAAAAAELDVQLQRQDQQQLRQQRAEEQLAPSLLKRKSVPAQRQEVPALATEHLARVSTAPAALVRMADELGSSSSKDEDVLSVAASSCLADAEGSECSTPSSSAAVAAAGNQQQQGSLGISSNGAGSVAQQEPGSLLPAEQVIAADLAAAAVATANGSSNGSSSSSSRPLPKIEYQISRPSPDLLQLRAHLPGVLCASDVCVDVVNAGPELQRLQLKVPGKFASVDVPLSQLLAAVSVGCVGQAGGPEGEAGRPESQAGSPGSGLVVAAVSGKLHRRRHTLSLKLHLADASAMPSAGAADSMVHWHSTSSADIASSSGSESDGSLVVPMSSVNLRRSVMSEMDLSSFFGRHSNGQMMAELRPASQAKQQQQENDVAVGSTATGTAVSKQKAGSKKSSSKKSKGRKRK